MHAATRADVYSLALADFHDVTTGSSSSSSGSFPATTGYDLVTGLGTPASGSTGNMVIQQLIAASVTVNTSTSSSGGGGGSVTVLSVQDNGATMDVGGFPFLAVASVNAVSAAGAAVRSTRTGDRGGDVVTSALASVNESLSVAVN